jgi:hypothetical protein
MTYLYNTPNATSIVDLFSYGNYVTNNVFGLFILVSVFLVMFLAMKQYPTEKAFASSSFTTALVSYMLSILGLVPSYAVLITTLMVITSVFMLWRT